MNSSLSPLCFSSMVFITNAVVSYYYDYALYSLLFIALSLSSIIHHHYKTFTTCYIDKFFVFAIVGYGTYVFYHKIMNSTKYNFLYCASIICLFLATVVLYYYGSAHNSFCFAEDPDECNYWHQWMHILSSIGHHLIVIM